MAGVVIIVASEADVGRNLGIVDQSFEDRFGFRERGDGLEGEKIGIGLEHRIDALGMKVDERGMADVVASVELRPVVQRRTIRAKRTGNPMGRGLWPAASSACAYSRRACSARATLCWIAERAACSAAGALRPISRKPIVEI